MKACNYLLITGLIFAIAETNAATTTSAVVVDNKANERDLSVDIKSTDGQKTYATNVVIPKKETKNVSLVNIPVPGDYVLAYSVPGINNANGTLTFKMTENAPTIVIPALKIPLATATMIIDNHSNFDRVNVELSTKDYKQKFSTETTVDAGQNKTVQLSNIIIPGTYVLYYFSPDFSGGGNSMNVELTKDGQVIKLPYTDYSYYGPGGY